MNLTWKTWTAFFLLTLMMGLNNIYSTLLTGWGDSGSIVAVVLCLIFLPKSDRNILNYNLGQTIASAGGSVGFAVAILASIYYLYQKTGIAWKPDLIHLSFLMMAVSAMGVAIAAPLRSVIIHWFFPSAIACGTILQAVTSDQPHKRKRAGRIMSIFGLISACLTVPVKTALNPGQNALIDKIALGKTLFLSLDPILYGIGIVVGLRIGSSMAIGSLLHELILSPKFEKSGLASADYIRWIAVGLMTLPAFSSMIFSFLMKHKHTLPPGFFPARPASQDALTPLQLAGIASVFTFAAFVASYEMNHLFFVSWSYTLLAAAIAGPMCFALGKVASETDINPVRLLAITLLFLFSIFEEHSAESLLAIGICGAAFAAVAVDLFYDLRTGYLISANPKQQIFLQFLGIIPVSFATVFFLHLLASHFNFGDGEYFPAPGAVIWATMAEGFASGAGALPLGVWAALAIASIVGTILSFFENWDKTRNYSLSSFALGISLLLPFEMCAAIFGGSVLRQITVMFGRRYGFDFEKQIKEDAFQAGSAIIAASSLAGILAVILITIGFLSIPKAN